MELVTNGKTMLMIHRPAAYAPRRKCLGPAQLRWCAQKLKAFADNRRVERRER